MEFSDLFTPLNWLEDAEIYNKAHEEIRYSDLIEAQILVIYFSMKGVDKDGVIAQFSDIYSEVSDDFPAKVINMPLDETREAMQESYDAQANWLTMDFGDPMITYLKHMYEISAIPHLVVINSNCSIISYHGILELEDYGKNALVSWLTTNLTLQKKKNYRKSLFVKGSSCSVNALLMTSSSRK